MLLNSRLMQKTENIQQDRRGHTAGSRTRTTGPLQYCDLRNLSPKPSLISFYSLASTNVYTNISYPCTPRVHSTCVNGVHISTDYSTLFGLYSNNCRIDCPREYMCSNSVCMLYDQGQKNKPDSND